MHTIQGQATRLWLIRLLVGLLVLAPYLHGHVGASAQAGVHLAGMHALHPASDASALDGHGPAEESMVVGVSPSLPQVGMDLLGLVACFLVATVLLKPSASPRPPYPPRRTPADTLYSLGWPPPSLAPPRA